MSQPSGLTIVTMSFLLYLSRFVYESAWLDHNRFTLCLPLAGDRFPFHFCHAVFPFLGCCGLGSFPSMQGGKLLSFRSIFYLNPPFLTRSINIQTCSSIALHASNKALFIRMQTNKKKLSTKSCLKQIKFKILHKKWD